MRCAKPAKSGFAVLIFVERQLELVRHIMLREPEFGSFYPDTNPYCRIHRVRFESFAH